jgi:hypothetical protein
MERLFPIVCSYALRVVVLWLRSQGYGCRLDCILLTVGRRLWSVGVRMLGVAQRVCSSLHYVVLNQIIVEALAKACTHL